MTRTVGGAESTSRSAALVGASGIGVGIATTGARRAGFGRLDVRSSAT
jgi:hypothetical protein